MLIVGYASEVDSGYLGLVCGCEYAGDDSASGSAAGADV